MMKLFTGLKRSSLFKHRMTNTQKSFVRQDADPIKSAAPKFSLFSWCKVGVKPVTFEVAGF